MNGGPVAVLDLDGTLHPATLGLVLLRSLVDHNVCDTARVGRLTGFLQALPPHQLRTPTTSRRAYRLYADAVAGARADVVQALAKDVWSHARTGLFPFARPLLDLLWQQGHTIVLLSGSPQEIVREVATDLGVERWQGAEFATDGSTYTGQVAVAPGIPGAKPGLLASLLGDAGRRRAAIAIGNSAADIALLTQARRPIAFEPHPPLRRAATRRGWPITDRDSVLPTLLAATHHGGSL